jgi:hypothetical protein
LCFVVLSKASCLPFDYFNTNNRVRNLKGYFAAQTSGTSASGIQVLADKHLSVSIGPKLVCASEPLRPNRKA